MIMVGLLEELWSGRGYDSPEVWFWKVKIKGKKVSVWIVCVLFIHILAFFYHTYLEITSLPIQDVLHGVDGNTSFIIAPSQEAKEFGLKKNGVLGKMYECIIQSNKSSRRERPKLTKSGWLDVRLSDVNITLNMTISEGNLTKLITKGVDKNGNQGIIQI